MPKYSFLVPYIPSRINHVKGLIDCFGSIYKDRKDYELCFSLSEYQNPCVAFNKAAANATGEYYILTSPECYHAVNILSGFDEEIKKHPDGCYIICSCMSIVGGVEHIWFQHSQFNNRMLHFCSCISKKNWIRIGGFCELYKYGQSYDDDDWLERVKQLHIPIVLRDDLKVTHMEHDRSYQNAEAAQKNCDLYNYIWDKRRIV